MEMFRNSAHTPIWGLESILFIALLGGIVLTVSRVFDWPSAGLLALVGLAFGAIEAPIAVLIAIALAAMLAIVFHGRPQNAGSIDRALREGTVLLGVALALAAGLHATTGPWKNARVDTQAVIDFERTLRIDPEVALQGWLIPHEWLLQAAHVVATWLFLPFVAGTLCWLYLTQEQRFRQYRTALAISALVALVIVSLHPVIAPGRMPGSGLVDTRALLGGPSNESASLPGLPLGWAALSGAALFVSVKHRLRWFWLAGPAALLAVICMATGQNYAVDLIVGLVIALAPFAVILWIDRRLGGPYYFSFSMLAPRPVARYLNSAAREIADVPRLRATVYSLGFLLTYLLARQAVDPGFTRYWGYMVTQIALTLVIIVVLSVHFSGEGGFSVLTHGIVIVTTYADTLGTAAHLYDRFISYDKFTHFFGCAAVVSALGDVLVNMARRGTIDWPPSKLILVAVALAVGAGMAWEIYEFIGDKLLDTGRHNGRVDTTYDLVSDSLGALVAAVFLYWWYFTAPAEVAPRRQAVVVTRGVDDERTRVDARQR